MIFNRFDIPLRALHLAFHLRALIGRNTMRRPLGCMSWLGLVARSNARTSEDAKLFEASISSATEMLGPDGPALALRSSGDETLGIGGPAWAYPIRLIHTGGP